MATITADIIASLAKDDDFGFEMRVGRELRSYPTKVRHGETYKDHRTGTERQFDYQCTVTNDWRRLQLAIECKNLFPDSPAVVCGHRRAVSESFHDMVCSSHGILQSRDGQSTSDGSVSEVMAHGPASALYPATDSSEVFVGKSVFRPKPPKDRPQPKLEKLPNLGFTIMGEDDCYDRWNQALGSAADMALRSLDFVRGRGNVTASVTLPVVVVPDGSLWQLEFDENGGHVAAPRLTDHVTLFRDHRVENEKRGTLFFRRIRLSHIHFVTLTGIASFLKTIGSADASFWVTAFPESLARNFVERLHFTG